MEKQKSRNESTLLKKFEESESFLKSSPAKAGTPRKYDMENSMLFTNISRADSTDDSFLENERLCKFEELVEEANANGTMIFDVEPPSELWNQSVMMPTLRESICENKKQSQEDIQKQTIYEEQEEEESRDESIELSPLEMVALTRPSTIIEETSSQCISTGNRTENTNKSSSIDLSRNSPKSQSSSSYRSTVDNSSSFKEKAHKRETLVFKHRKFFTEEDEKLIFSPSRHHTRSQIKLTPLREKEDLIQFDENAATPQPKFNDTLEEMEYFMEKGKQIMEQTPLASRDKNASVLPTPMFSCKRSRILSEVAAREFQPIPKRGPLLNLFDSPKGSSSPRL